MAPQNHLRVRVRLAAVPAPELEGRRSCPGGRKHCPEGRRVLIERLALAGGVHRPQVAELVVRIIKARPVPMLTQPRRVDREAVREDRRTGTCAITEVGMHPGAVGHAHAQTEAVVGVSVNLARIRRLDEPVFVVVSIPVEQTPKAQARLVAVRIVAVGFRVEGSRGQFVMGVIGEVLDQAAVGGLGQAVGVVVVGVGIGGRRMGTAAGFAGELVSPVVAVSGLVPALVAGGDIAGIIVAVDDAVLQGGVRPKVADAIAGKTSTNTVSDQL